MAITETYLELAPEFGGTRFGPFSGMEVRLGSDASSNDIVLPENLGVLAEHVKLLNQGDGSFIVAPVERTAGVFVYRAGSGAKQVTSPVAVQGSVDTYSADSFALVTPEGPRFYVLNVLVKSAAKEKQSKLDMARKRLSGRSLFSEIKRQGLVLFLTQKGGQQFQRWFTFIKTGAILRPRYLITGAAVLAGWVFAGGLSLVACQAAVGGVETMDDLEVCNAKLESYEGDSGGTGPNIENLAAQVLKTDGALSTQWKAALRSDSDFNIAFKQEIKALMNNQKRLENLRWVYRRKNSDFVKVRKAMKAAGWPDEMTRVMAYTAAIEGRATEREWTFQESDSLGNGVCARGPMMITWRQAMQLKLSNVPYTTMMTLSDYGAAGEPEKHAALVEHASTLRNHVATEADQMKTTERYSPVNDNTTMCIVAEEAPSEDPRSRENLAELMKQLNKTIGPSGRIVAPKESNYAGLSRLLMFYAADYDGDYNGLDLTKSTAIPSSMLNDAKKVKPYAISRAAETLAKAVVIPCLGRLDPNYDDLSLKDTVGWEPEEIECAYTFALVQYVLD